MVGTVLALMIADIKRVSQVFRWFKNTDMLEISQVLKLQKACDIADIQNVDNAELSSRQSNTKPQTATAAPVWLSATVTC